MAVGLLFVGYGVVWMGRMHEDNKNRKIGFGAISGSVTKYRTYVGTSGSVALRFGVLAIAKN